MAFAGSFIHYIVLMIIMLFAAAVGIFTGKKLRDRKEAKTASEEAGAKINE